MTRHPPKVRCQSPSNGVAGPGLAAKIHAGGIRGRSMVNTQPRPGRSRTRTSPPLPSILLRVLARPTNPAPTISKSRSTPPEKEGFRGPLLGGCRRGRRPATFNGARVRMSTRCIERKSCGTAVALYSQSVDDDSLVQKFGCVDCCAPMLGFSIRRVAFCGGTGRRSDAALPGPATDWARARAKYQGDA